MNRATPLATNSTTSATSSGLLAAERRQRHYSALTASGFMVRNAHPGPHAVHADAQASHPLASDCVKPTTADLLAQ